MLCSLVMSLGLWCAVGTQAQAPATSTAGRVRVVESSEERNTVLEEKAAIEFGVVQAPELTIQVNDAVRYRSIDGFGASLTDSSAWLLWNQLSEAQRKEAL